MFYEKGILKNFADLTEKDLCWSLFKLQFWRPVTLLKTTSTLVLSCEMWKIFKNNYFEEHLWATAFKLYLKTGTNTGVFLWILKFYFAEHLRGDGSEILVRGSLFNKVASLMVWRPLLKRDCGTGIYLWIVWNF